MSAYETGSGFSMGKARVITPSSSLFSMSQLAFRSAYMYTRFLLWGKPYSALLTTRHSTE